MTGDGTNSYTWDRANRMLSMGSTSYAYDGAGNRIQQTVSATVTQYLLDLQPGLVNVLQTTQGANTTRYVHAPRGIHEQKDASGNWEWMLQDGLGSVRSVVDSSLNPLESRLYEPYGTPFGTSGTVQTSYGFTGEMTDANDLLYLRARYYAPSLGVFTGLDPMETPNRYRYVGANPVNFRDPSGLQFGDEGELPGEGGAGWGITVVGVQTVDGPVDLQMPPGLNMLTTTDGRILRAAVVVGPATMLQGESNPSAELVNTFHEIQNWNSDLIQVNTNNLVPAGLVVYVEPPGTPDELAAVLNGQDRTSSIQVTHVPTTSVAPQVNPATNLFLANVRGDTDAAMRAVAALVASTRPCDATITALATPQPTATNDAECSRLRRGGIFGISQTIPDLKLSLLYKCRPTSRATMQSIQNNGSWRFPHDDNKLFGNRTPRGRLDLFPPDAAGYFREYTVEDPATYPDRGDWRIVTWTLTNYHNPSDASNYYYSDDHFEHGFSLDLDQ